MVKPTITARYLAKLAQLNMAQLVPTGLIMSPESFHELQKEISLEIGTAMYYEYTNLENGLKEHLFGIPVEVDSRLDGETVRLEIEI